jgi:hypothetical protein
MKTSSLNWWGQKLVFLSDIYIYIYMCVCVCVCVCVGLQVCVCVVLVVVALASNSGNQTKYESLTHLGPNPITILLCPRTHNGSSIRGVVMLTRQSNLNKWALPHMLKMTSPWRKSKGPFLRYTVWHITGIIVCWVLILKII